jgi:outer membrane protein assembly factor BamB
MNEHRRGNGIGAYSSCLILLLYIIAFTQSAAAADTMFRANPEHTGIFDNSGIVPANTQLWRFKTGASVLSSPAVSNGVVYVRSFDKNLYAIDAVTGTEIWRFATGADYSLGSPAVSNGVVYTGSSDKNLSAIDAVTGKEIWRFTTGAFVLSSPAVSNGVVYVGSMDNNLYAIDAVTGKEIWRFTTGAFVQSSPAVSNGVIYVGSWDNNTYAIDAVTGREKWRFAMGNFVPSSPAVSNGVVYVGSMDNNLYAIDAVTGREKWRFATGNGVSSSPAVSNGVVYVGSMDNNLYAIDTVTGKEKWRFATGNGISSSPAVSNGVVYVGSNKNNLYAIDTVTGKEKWRFATGNGVTSSPAVSNGVVYVGSMDNNLYAVGRASSTALPIKNTGDSNSPLPIIIILGVLFLAGGGYAIYRMKKKPSGIQPPVIAGKEPGKEIQAKKGDINVLREKAQRLIYEVEKIGSIPDSINKNLQVQDIETLEKTINDLDLFIANAKPDLTISLDSTHLSTERWHKLGITLTNTGLAHVENVTFAFSNEFETKGIKPISVKAGQSSRTDISIIPKNVGNILLEITLTYKDIKNREYKTVREFWIDVVEKGSTTSPPSETPSSPVSQFTPRPLTLKQLPSDLSDRYTESEFIGKGGFARVFKAKRKDGKFVAVKIPISMDAVTGKSFIAEMQNWTKLSHPNIVRLYDFNIMPMPYFEEELCDSALADQSKPIESEEAAWILFNICEGLKFAHNRKIIHRDLKPQNVLLKNGVPKISDWGLSRIISESTTTSATSFTPYYAAPEQINNRVKDERTDIWQLGVILYELVTGVLPFTGDSMIEIGMNIATKDPKRPSETTPDAKVIDAVVMKCLEKDPAKRYQSVLELQKDLALYLRKNYAELLKTSVSVQDYNRSAYYCGDLVMINLLTGDLPTSYKYLLDLVHYSKGDVNVEARELSEQIKMRMDMGITEIPEELIQKAEIIVHQVSVGFRNPR